MTNKIDDLQIDDLRAVLYDTIKMVDAKQEIIKNMSKKIVDLSDAVEFWEDLAEKRQKQLDLAVGFIGYIICQNKIKSSDIKERAENTLASIYNQKFGDE